MTHRGAINIGMTQQRGAGYRAWSHWRALQGARKAMGLFQDAHAASTGQHQDEDSRSGRKVRMHWAQSWCSYQL